MPPSPFAVRRTALLSSGFLFPSEHDRTAAAHVLAAVLPLARSFRNDAACHLSRVPSPSALQAVGARFRADPFQTDASRRFHPPALSVLEVSHPLDGFLHPLPCGLVSSRSRSWGSPAARVPRSTFRQLVEHTLRVSSSRSSPLHRRCLRTADFTSVPCGTPDPRRTGCSPALLPCASSGPGPFYRSTSLHRASESRS